MDPRSESSGDDPPWYRPPIRRVLCLPAPTGCSPWARGTAPVRPIWRLHRPPYGGVWQQPKLVDALAAALRDGTVDPTMAPIIDARQLSLGAGYPPRPRMRGTGEGFWYAVVRGITRRPRVRGTPLTTMVRWGAPDPWGVARWTAPVLGALWVWPRLHPHERWVLSPLQWLDSYHRWFPFLSFDSGLVLDVRMLAVAGVPIPLPDAMADQLRPSVRLLSLADLPQPTQWAALRRVPSDRGWLDRTPWLPGQSPRYSLARWRAFCDQFPDAPVTLPAARRWRDVPRWLRPALTPPVSGTLARPWLTPRDPFDRPRLTPPAGPTGA